jgi:hypothetical protein
VAARDHLSITASIITIDNNSNKNCNPFKTQAHPFLFDTSSIQSLVLDDLEDEEIQDLAQFTNMELKLKARHYESSKIQHSIRLESGI